ncbi:MAG: GNAT family N-acetyltransferase [Lachnospiraceae bacterium]|nr:GNAT family N-acetyltransferase [Lachnospiraceae bacterium]
MKKIKNSDWGAGGFLHDLLKSGTFFDALGKRSIVLLLTEGDELISFCTYAEKDDIQPTGMTPWMGFVYTFPEYRGNHYSEILAEEVEKRAKADGVRKIYVSTTHTGLYEKIGYEYKNTMLDVDGHPSRIYVKEIS